MANTSYSGFICSVFNNFFYINFATAIRAINFSHIFYSNFYFT